RKIKKADPTAKVSEVRGLFFEYPHIPTIRKYWKVALEMVTTHYQNTGKNPPPSFKALNPGDFHSCNRFHAIDQAIAAFDARAPYSVPSLFRSARIA
ncbi:hypothetical protein, partial [Mesorhizobium sp. M1D.F.Ca.ET.183.01.1.1]|uniref:hypothetical protein n=1 Tax=Mesorhizobium sp. M1D.F.Ca.ET.183.01.1.1 TaxID=2496666 RepID=UPI001AEE57E6